MTRAACVLLAFFVGMPDLARGAGFQIAEQGAAAVGMAGAFTAKADDASAVFYNAAGIAQLRGWHAYLGSTLVITRPSAEGTSAFPLLEGSGDAKVHGDVQVIPLPTMYLTYGLPHNFSVGIGAFTQFGIKVTWPDAWPGRFVSQDVALSSITINPTVAWRPQSWIAIGAGLDVTPASVDLRRSIDLVAAEGSLRYRGNTTGVGANVGVLLQTPRSELMPPISIGVHYRSRQTLSVAAEDGAIHVVAPASLSPVLHDVRASTSIPLPDLLSAGIGVGVTPQFFVQGQFDWTRWSRFQVLSLRSPESPALNLDIPEKWKDGYTLRVGGEYKFGELRLRAGVGYDWNPVPRATLSPITPDGNRWLVSAGGSLNLPHQLVGELAVMGVIVNSRTSDLLELPIHYSNWAVLAGFSISYRSGLR